MDFVCSDYNWIWGLITDITLNICLVSQTQQFLTRFFTTFLHLLHIRKENQTKYNILY